MRLATRKAMAVVLACALILNLFTLINPRMERAGAEPAPLWVKQSSQSLAAIAYGNGIYVGLTTDNNNPKIVTSTDLVNWEEQTIVGHTKLFKTVEFLNGQFVIGNHHYDNTMAGATFLYSSDGVHWTGATVNEVPQFNISSIAHGGGNYVAGTTFGQMITSADGLSWTSAVYRMSIISEMQHFNGHFIAAGFAEDMGPPFGKATILTSANGVTWHKTAMGDMTPSPAAALKSIASDGQTIVTGGYTGVYRLSASNLNQPNITTEKIDGFDNNYSINKMVYTQNDGGLFIIVGSNGTIHTSPDSYTWTNESIIGATAEFSDVIEVGNSVVAVGPIGVYKRLGQAIDSELTPATGSFDKNMANQADVTTTISLNWNTLNAIKNSGQALVPGTDYTVSPAGDEVAIKKEYLAAQPVGTITLTFEFSGGADQAMAITVSDTTPQNSTISPTTASFDKNASAQSDVTTTLTLNGNTLFNIYEGSYKLRLDTDYTISAAGDEVVLKKEYLATLPVGTVTLTYKFTGGADQAMEITVSDTTPANSAVSPTTASFDQKASAQSDVTTTLTLNGNTLFNIYENSYKLRLDTDYTISAAGDEVVLKKEYLTTLPVGTTTLTFKFTGGADQAMLITVSDSTPQNSTMSPTTASFDKKASAQSDVTTTLTLNGNTLFNIYEGSYKLRLDTDYTISAAGDEVVLKKEYLTTLPVGTVTLTFKFTGGADQAMLITVSDSTPQNSTISPTTASFDKKTSAQSDVITTLTLSGNTLDEITYSGQALVLDTDYTVTSNTVTIKREYLATLPSGIATLTFRFSAGSDQALTISISDSSPNNSTINPTTANFDKNTSAQSDVTTTLTLNGNDLIGITHGGQELVPDTDYTITDNTVTIRKEYLTAQPVGIATLVFRFSAGSEHALTITISDSTPSNSEISPATATFDKKSSAQKDVAATLTLNGNTLSGISSGAKLLELNKDYKVTDNTVTIKKSFLAAQPVGTMVLTFQFSAGSSETLTITIVNTTPASPPSGGGNETAQPEPNNAADIYVNGQVVSAGTAKESTRNNQSVLTIIVDQAKLAERLDSEGQNPVITILMSSKSDIAAGQLTGNMVKDMENKNATLELKTDNASYFLPANQIDIDGIQTQLGGPVSLQDVVIHIEMAKPVQAMASVVENAAKQGEFEIVAAPVDFTVSASYQNRSVEVNRYSAYVQRQIALPEGVLNKGITTGIVVEPDGSVRHVPTKVTVAEGRYYAQINSLTNSTYAVIWHPLEFADAAGHWAKDAINDMGSRMIVDGRGNGSFKPNEAMTRAEFAAILVRGLGLKLSEGKAPFSDVNASDWYNNAIATAHAYQFISGFEDGTFRPNDKLTRQQAMVMIANAMKLTQLKDKLPVQAADERLQVFGLAITSGWAKQSIADCIQAGIIVGKSGSELALQDSITRAEVAVMIQRLLKNSDLI